MSLQHLAPELVLLVTEYLPQKDIASLTLTARRFPYILTTSLYSTAITFVEVEHEQDDATYYELPSGKKATVDFDVIALQDSPCWKSEHVLEFFRRKDLNLFTAWDSSGTTLLHQFAARGATPILQVLFERGIDVDARMNGMYTPLAWMVNLLQPQHWARFMPLVLLFLRNGADILAMNDRRQTLLYEAVQTAPAIVVSFIIGTMKEAGGNIWAVDDVEVGPLCKATTSENSDAVRVLLDHGADVLEADIDGCNPLHRAAATGEPQICKAIISAMHQVNGNMSVLTNDNWNALHIALNFGNDEAAALLIQAGIDITTKDSLEKSPLDLMLQHGAAESLKAYLPRTRHLWPLQRLQRSQLYAAVTGNGEATVETMVRLLRLGVVTSIDNSMPVPNEYTPLHLFCMKWDRVIHPRKMASNLLELGERVDVKDPYSNTPIHTLLLTRRMWDNSTKYLRVMRTLLFECEEPLDYKNAYGSTVFHYAVGHNDMRLIQMIYDKIDEQTFLACNQYGFTALHCAVNPRCDMAYSLVNGNIMDISNCYSVKPVIEFLISKGLYINAKSNKGRTALHMACSDGSKLSAVNALIEAGSDIGMPDYKGCTALHWANVHACDATVEALLLAGADLHEGCLQCDPRLFHWKGFDNAPESVQRMRSKYGDAWSEVLNETVEESA